MAIETVRSYLVIGLSFLVGLNSDFISHQQTVRHWACFWVTPLVETHLKPGFPFLCRFWLTGLHMHLDDDMNRSQCVDITIPKGLVE